MGAVLRPCFSLRQDAFEAKKNHRPARSDTLRTVPSPLTKNGELIVSRPSLRRGVHLVEAERPCVVWQDIEGVLIRPRAAKPVTQSRLMSERKVPKSLARGQREIVVCSCHSMGLSLQQHNARVAAVPFESTLLGS